ncbi:MAG TPA: DUF1501 domain-containing protein [Pirellulaceae bacterium]|nr:DUF1501 domain-containing protein [Pirellulaceae bacterium]
MHIPFTRRGLLSLTAGATLSGWLPRLAAHATEEKQVKSCILLWMAGGPSHLDTFDLKPDAPDRVRGEFKPIDTSVPGIQISEHFPKFARQMEHAALLRGMSTVESDHQLATYHVHTGYQKRAGGIAFPSLGALASRELGRRDFPLPNFVCIGEGPRHGTRSGFLGPEHQPLDVTSPDRGTDFLEPLASRAEFQRQLALLRRFDDAFQDAYRDQAAQAHRSALERSVKLMNAEQKRAFDLSLEPDAVRERYGSGSFGQGCLMARRLVESGVRFVEVMSGGGVGWDTHRDNFPRTRALSLEADAGMAALIDDLNERGRLDSTLVIWMGEFGRSPQTTSGGGRNHWSRAWSTVLAGGGIRGGQVIGKTDRDAAEVLERPISVVDFLATVCTILGIDYTRQNRAPGVERPIPIVDTSKMPQVVSELL